MFFPKPATFQPKCATFSVLYIYEYHKKIWFFHFLYIILQHYY